MNQFDQHLKTARRRHQRLLLLGFSGIVLAAFIIITIIIVTRGTRVEIQPEEAVATANMEVSDGLAMLFGQTLYSLSFQPSITVEADGFYTRQQQLTDKDFGNVLLVKLKPLPATLHLTSPEQDNRTTWLIDNETYQVGNELVRELEPGDYDVSVIHPYYQVRDISFSLKRGERVEQQVELQAVTGELVINSTPAAASILVNNEELGKSPQTISLKGGQYELQVLLDSFEPVSEIIEITRGADTVERDYRLEPEKGQVNVILKPDAGKLVLNNLQVTGRDSFRLDINREHTMTYSRPGYFPLTRTFRVNTERATELMFELQPESGEVELTASPGAQVSINGKLVGETPLKIELPAVSHEIVFSRAGYRSISKDVLPSASSTKLISVSLVPEKIATLQEAPLTYRHHAGGTMKLYKPRQTFTMGAARSEPGQRANEFLRTVKLGRPFYAGVNEVNYAAYSRFDKNSAGNPQDPVTGITWQEAVSFCNWLSRQEDLDEVYTIQNGRLIGINPASNGYRLLTEAEWEWLARVANRKKQTRFAWGDDTVIPKNAVNVADESAQGTVRSFVPRYNDGYAGVAPVGSFEQELSGLFDQGGNVSEWVHDVYSLLPPKQGQVETDPFDRQPGDNHVVKGANWRSATLTQLRASYREGLTGFRDDVGFRLGRYLYTGED